MFIMFIYIASTAVFVNTKMTILMIIIKIGHDSHG